MSLKGKAALVTGSTSGIGLGIARALAREGASIAYTGFGDEDTLCGLRAEFEHAALGGAAYVPGDLSRPAAVAALVSAAVGRFGRLDILVNNAGMQHTAPIEHFPEEKWDAVIALNLSAVFHATKAAIPVMRAQGWGRIVNIASAHGLVASPEKSAYVAAKHGVIGLTKVSALELANSGVTANAICPGWVLTPLVEKQLHARAEREHISRDEASKRLLDEKQALREFTTPEHIGELVIFLCSDAARTITGSNLSIDGGWLAR